MTVALLFLKKYWMYLVIIAAVVAGMLYVNGLRLTIEQQRTQIVKLQADNKLLQAANTQLQEANTELVAAIEKQNKAVQQIADDADRRVKLSDEALAKSKVENDKLRKRYAAVLNTPPAVPGDDCASVTILLNQYLELRKGEQQ